MDYAQQHLRTQAHRQTLRRRHNSDDPNDVLLALKRTKMNVVLSFNFDCKTPSTQFFSRPFHPERPIAFTVPLGLELELTSHKTPLIPVLEQQFRTTFKSFIDAFDLMLGKKEICKSSKEKKKSAKEEKLSNLFSYFESDISDISFLHEMTKIPKPAIKNAWEKYLKGKDMTKDYRGKQKILNEEQIEFIKAFFSDNRNFNKSVMNLYTELMIQFNLDAKSLSYWTIYDYLENLSFSYKKIIYKNNNANTLKVKETRKEVALKILGGHIQSLDFIYIDETSFNFETWPLRGWAPLGQHQFVKKPAKSKTTQQLLQWMFLGYLL